MPQYLISEDGTVFWEVVVLGPGEPKDSLAYSFPDSPIHAYTAPAWRIHTDKAELRRRFTLSQCDAVERRAYDLQRQAALLLRHADDIRAYLKGLGHGQDQDR